jgi:hypothetical protein
MNQTRLGMKWENIPCSDRKRKYEKTPLIPPSINETKKKRG